MARKSSKVQLARTPTKPDPAPVPMLATVTPSRVRVGMFVHEGNTPGGCSGIVVWLSPEGSHAVFQTARGEYFMQVADGLHPTPKESAAGMMTAADSKPEGYPNLAELADRLLVVHDELLGLESGQLAWVEGEEVEVSREGPANAVKLVNDAYNVVWGMLGGAKHAVIPKWGGR